MHILALIFIVVCLYLLFNQKTPSEDKHEDKWSNLPDPSTKNFTKPSPPPPGYLEELDKMIEPLKKLAAKGQHIKNPLRHRKP